MRRGAAETKLYALEDEGWEQGEGGAIALAGAWEVGLRLAFAERDGWRLWLANGAAGAQNERAGEGGSRLWRPAPAACARPR